MCVCVCVSVYVCACMWVCVLNRSLQKCAHVASTKFIAPYFLEHHTHKHPCAHAHTHTNACTHAHTQTHARNMHAVFITQATKIFVLVLFGVPSLQATGKNCRQISSKADNRTLSGQFWRFTLPAAAAYTHTRTH